MPFPVTDSKIDIRHVAWRGDLLDRYHILLVGGSLFDAKKADFLIKKPTESIQVTQVQAPMPESGSPGPGGPSPYTSYMPSNFTVGMDAYTYRLQKASYKPMIASLFGYLAARVFPNDPEVVGEERYQNLIEDCDGDGRTLLAVARDALINALAYSVSCCPCGSYLFLPDLGGDSSLRITTVDARSVIDWEEELGQLTRLRMRTVEPRRDDDFGPQSKWLWTWKVYGPDGCRSWVGEKSIRSPNRPSQAEIGESEVYDYSGELPFVRVKLAEHQFLMDQLASPIVESFNLEADIASLCGKISNAQLVIETMDKDIGKVILPQLGVILVDPGGGAGFQSPDPACADPLLKYKDVLRESIYNAINASAMRASADLIQNPRQAATAKALDLEPWRAWSATFSAPVRSAFCKALGIMAKFYGGAAPELKWPKPLEISKDGINEALGGGKKDGKDQAGAVDETVGSLGEAGSSKPAAKPAAA